MIRKRHPRCKVRGCKECHWKHYCVFCRNHNSNHFSRDCPIKSEQYCKEFWDACALILYHPGTKSFLLQHRSKRMRNGPNMFGIISGRRETTEWDPLNTVIREAQEEFFGTTWNKSTFMQNFITSIKIDSTHCYIVRSTDRCLGNPSCDWELNKTIYSNGHVWVTFEELKQLVFNDTSKDSIRMWEYRKNSFKQIWNTLRTIVGCPEDAYLSESQSVKI